MTRSLKIICSNTSRGWLYFQKVVVSHESPKNFTLWRVFTWVTWRWWETAGQQRAPHHWAEDTPADICFFSAKTFQRSTNPFAAGGQDGGNLLCELWERGPQTWLSKPAVAHYRVPANVLSACRSGAVVIKYLTVLQLPPQAFLICKYESVRL